MRLEADGREVRSVSLGLTRTELKEMVDTIAQMLADPAKHSHEHVSDEATYEREITVWLDDERA